MVSAMSKRRRAHPMASSTMSAMATSTIDTALAPVKSSLWASPKM